ncbi:DUF3943 domain-containing protein [Mucilaginibacter sp. L3T2-6]|uniref:DUF3943 domain-containing protein n=1 Tax=Mucilaginibacter sp. L3T2-6 TaxID=3062491 RepID=UPI0026775275|nr:DUF3943 domain-containing protein [Mucilaginibacter sp. L3T2-6]MDO3644017.1 DUF3943 domain-containing protein [Mucilaginibacter sp. L3T2-6]MDV6216468.1 DUF3943 domain-containing protein [Mucilaginibacter sp. L3T2-6]
MRPTCTHLLPAKYFFVLLCVAFIFPKSLFGQIEVDRKQQREADSLAKAKLFYTPRERTHHFGRAALFLGIAEVTPWLFDRYVTQKDYARISWKTVGHNINPAHWEFDNDEFQTNQFGHPYHGSNFYSAFRVNGYSFWQAAPAAFAGSYLWETFAENQAPAPNDFINTSYGGIILGEMTYRLSNKIVNNRTRGFKRQVDEVFAFLVNPMNGLHRITTGKWGKVSGNSTERDSSKIYAEFGLGIRTFNNGLHNAQSGWFGHIKLLYGTPYENYRVPFSNISVNAEFGKDDSTRINVVTVYGSLAGWEIASTEKQEHLAVLSANYDYVRNVAFFYGAQSLRINVLSEFDISKKITINTQVGGGALILGAVPDRYFTRGRNYDYGSGAAYNLSGGINFANKLFYNLNYRGGWLVTLNGSASHYFLHTLSSEFGYHINKSLELAAEPGYLILNSYYNQHPTINSKYPYFRASLRYTVNFQ